MPVWRRESWHWPGSPIPATTRAPKQSDEMLTHFLTELSSSDFSHVCKESTGMTPLQFVTRQRITLAQQLIRETSRSLNRGRDRSPLHQSKPFRVGLQTGNRPYAERLPAAPLKRE